MKEAMNTNFYKIALTCFYVVAACIIFFFLVLKVDVIYSFLMTLLKIMMPFIIGFIFAYLLNPIVKAFDEEVFSRVVKNVKLNDEKKRKLSNNLAIGHTFILMIALLILFFNFIIPQLLQSIESLIINIPIYLEQIRNYLLRTIQNNSDLENWVTANYDVINTYLADAVNNTFLPVLQDWMAVFSTGLLGMIKILYNILIGFIIAIYFLADKDGFKALTKKTLYCLFSIKIANNILDNARQMDRVFGGFIVGKLLDSAILGIITFLFMYILGLPYALLIGVIVGITNIIPYFGSLIGAVPSAFLVLLQSPSQCLIFLVFIFILHQIDGNYIGPKIVGNRIGIKSFWVLFAILLFGGLWGITGMIVAVPLFVLISEYITKKTNEILIRKKLPIETRKYTDLDRINSSTKKLVENNKENK